MSSLKKELARWRVVSKNLDELCAIPGIDEEDRTCPYCDKTSVRAEILETVSGVDKGMAIGFFSCGSCNEHWSVRIK